MSPVLAYHATRPACRDSIRERGLIAACPSKMQTFGVYVFRNDDSFDHVTERWTRRNRKPPRWFPDLERQDVWQVAYIGPMGADRYVVNAFVCLWDIPAAHVELISAV